MCGKRTENIAGHLRLMKKIPKQGYTSISTVRSWALCNRCMERFVNLQSVGDQIKEEIELKLDQIRVDKNPLKLLGDLNTQKTKEMITRGDKKN